MFPRCFGPRRTEVSRAVERTAGGYCEPAEAHRLAVRIRLAARGASRARRPTGGAIIIPTTALAFCSRVLLSSRSAMGSPRRDDYTRGMRYPNPELNAFDILPAILWQASVARRSGCPHCKHAHIVRWGTFSGRQRYRCRQCTRTFSLLTGTPAAYTKKLTLWAPYARCMAYGLTVRQSAAHVGIHTSTAFRWRHAMLRSAPASDRDCLAGWIELDSTRFAYSEKGRRNLPRARSHGFHAGALFGEYCANILIACDRRGDVITGIASLATSAYIWSAEIDQVLRNRVRGRPIVTCRQGRFGAAALFARRRRGRFFDARARARHATGRPHIRNARAYAHRLKDWMRRFRGVATRYLSNYLLWHRILDRRRRRSTLKRSSAVSPDALSH